MASPAVAAKPAAKPAANKPSPKQNAPPKSKGAGRPKAPLIRRVARGYKLASTGETRNSPMTDPNVIFWLGIGLIVVSGWSSGRLKNIFSIAWSGQSAQDYQNWFTTIKVTGSQFLFLFILVITARAIPPLARIWLVIIAGMWILYLMNNPQMLQILNWTSTGAQNQQQYNDLVSNIGKKNNPR